MIVVSGSAEELQAAVDAEVRRLSEERARVLALAAEARLLFLDFDGVLNHADHFVALKAAGRDKSEEPLDPSCVARLSRLVEESGAYVVVSSSFRIGRSVSDLREILVRGGFAHGERVIGKTPQHRSGGNGLGGRGTEVAAWLRALPRRNERYVAVDDHDDMDEGLGHGPAPPDGAPPLDRVRDHLVLTASSVGLTDRDVERALRIFDYYDRADRKGGDR